MPRRTRLELVNERPAIDADAVMAAETALNDAERGFPLASPDEIIAALRAESAQKERIAAAAIEQANQQRDRADQAEARVVAAAGEAEKIRTAAQTQIEAVQHSAAQVVASAERKVQAATAAVAVAGMAQHAAKGFAFLLDRVPALFSLVGAFILGRDMLPAPTLDQLALLAIYGAVAVAPSVWLSRRS